MKHHHPRLVPLCLGLLAFAAGESAFAAERIPAGDEPDGSTTIIVAADYRRETTDGGPSLDLSGGSVEYLRAAKAGGGFQVGLTTLSGNYGPDAPDSAGTSIKSKTTEVIFEALYTPASATWLAFGLEYFHNQSDSTSYRRYKHLVDRGTPGRPNYVWDGSYDTKEGDEFSSSGNSLFLKSTLSGHSWRLVNGNRSSLTLTPSLEVEAGYLFGEDDLDGTFGYIGAAKVGIAYMFGPSTLFLDGGYRCQGAFEAGSETLSGEFARLGFGYRW